MRAVLIVALLLVGVCASAAAVVTLLFTVYAVWRLYDSIPRVVIVEEWPPDPEHVSPPYALALDGWMMIEAGFHGPAEGICPPVDTDSEPLPTHVVQLARPLLREGG